MNKVLMIRKYLTNGKWWALAFNSNTMANIFVAIAGSGIIISLFGIGGTFYTLSRIKYHINVASLNCSLILFLVGIFILLTCGLVWYISNKLYNKFLGTK